MSEQKTDNASASPLNQGHIFSGSRDELSKISLLDLRPQFERLRDEIGALVLGVLDHGQFIKGPEIDRKSVV